MAHEEYLDGDVILICSDGLSSYVEHDVFENIIGKNTDLNLCCDQLIEKVKEAGARDNTTIILYRWGEAK